MENVKPNPTLCDKVLHTYEIIGKRWTGPIIHALTNGPMRFGEIQAFISEVSNRMLNERLKELESCGVIVRNVITDRPIRTEYALTEKGKELGDALSALDAWAHKWL
ncbi:winged helix-turn-helix transcriptional regulator [Alicyclobacillus acidiphilus]|uniref:winged helix-turn-helix transcriptional regulator n=1 Tax=Alicyclobacillus acidiphilus TaxID=182455 RepID=UPI00083651A8|nr:helix-turn-helix domain-containing protein [Alicyclobacillus acidiphilus]